MTAPAEGIRVDLVPGESGLEGAGLYVEEELRLYYDPRDEPASGSGEWVFADLGGRLSLGFFGPSRDLKELTAYTHWLSWDAFALSDLQAARRRLPAWRRRQRPPGDSSDSREAASRQRFSALALVGCLLALGSCWPTARSGPPPGTSGRLILRREGSGGMYTLVPPVRVPSAHLDLRWSYTCPGRGASGFLAVVNEFDRRKNAIGAIPLLRLSRRGPGGSGSKAFSVSQRTKSVLLTVGASPAASASTFSSCTWVVRLVSLRG